LFWSNAEPRQRTTFFKEPCQIALSEGLIRNKNRAQLQLVFLCLTLSLSGITVCVIPPPLLSINQSDLEPRIRNGFEVFCFSHLSKRVIFFHS
jgi:hypothetical protein